MTIFSIVLITSAVMFTGCEKNLSNSDEEVNISLITKKTEADFSIENLSNPNKVEPYANAIWEAKNDGILTEKELSAIGNPYEDEELELALILSEKYTQEGYYEDKIIIQNGYWIQPDGSWAPKYPLDHPKYDPTKVPVLPPYEVVSGSVEKETYQYMIKEIREHLPTNMSGISNEVEKYQYFLDIIEDHTTGSISSIENNTSEISLRSNTIGYEWTGGDGIIRWWACNLFPCYERVAFGNPCNAAYIRVVNKCCKDMNCGNICPVNCGEIIA